MSETETAEIGGYHAHVYYDADSKERAAHLRAAIEARFAVRMGRWHDRPIGPHPCWSYQVAFGPELFGEIIPWLSLNRDGLVIFTHPETGDEIADHSDHAIWMGEMMRLDMEALR